MKQTCRFVLALVLAATAHAAVRNTGTYTANLTITWNGQTRYFDLYVPKTLAAQPALWVMNHPTEQVTTQPVPFDKGPLETLADTNGFIIAWPISTWNGRSWYWDAFFLDYSFTLDPDDSGFIRALILQLEGQYPIYPGAVFVAGMSSGAFMALRAGVESADLIAAVGSASGQLYSENTVNVIPQPVQPVSAIILNGDADNRVGYCGQKNNWGNSTSPGVDVTVDWLVATNACTTVSTTQPLCTNGQPTPDVNGLDATGCAGNTEILFSREIGVGHTWVPGTETIMWNFFQAHRR